MLKAIFINLTYNSLTFQEIFNIDILGSAHKSLTAVGEELFQLHINSVHTACLHFGTVGLDKSLQIPRRAFVSPQLCLGLWQELLDLGTEAASRSQAPSESLWSLS